VAPCSARCRRRRDRRAGRSRPVGAGAEARTNQPGGVYARARLPPVALV